MKIGRILSVLLLCSVAGLFGCALGGQVKSEERSCPEGTLAGDANGIECTPVEVETPMETSGKVSGYAWVPAGSFVMGSPKEEEGKDIDEVQVEVSLSRGFWLKQTEVTQGEWMAMMGSNPSAYSSCGDKCPVEQVGWYDGLVYMNKLSALKGLSQCYELSGCSGKVGTDYACSSVEWKTDCNGYRYPTQAEWEYAARGATAGARYGSLDAIAWHKGNGGVKTHEVGTKQANAYGLYDMLGNVWEWTWDEYNKELLGGVDPVSGGYIMSNSAQRVLRGCSLSSFAQWCLVANRFGGSPDIRGVDLGLRPARSGH